MIHRILEEDGKNILEEHQRAESFLINTLENKKHDILLQSTIVEDAKDVLELQKETYARLDAVGKIRPQHEFKSQVERALSIIQTEETSMLERSKIALMEEATIAVTKKLLTDKKLQKASLDTAIAQLTGKKGGPDVVKDSFIEFFKAKQATPVDEAAEMKSARENIVTRLNAIASNEGFYFRFDADGKPNMIA
jgi:NAD-dependent DNA ligase